MGHLNGILARVGGNLNKNFQKSQMPGGLAGGGGMLKLRFDRYIVFYMILPSISRTPDNSNFFLFPLKVRIIQSRPGSRL